MLKPLDMAHKCLEEVIDREDLAIDATMGNGSDTVFLSNLTNRVIAFDIQKEAIEATAERLKSEGKTARLILDGHENIRAHVNESVRAGIFNLGYLPQSDKAIITRPETTIKALSNLMGLLSLGGRIALMLYQGHDGALDEVLAVEKFCQDLGQKSWEVLRYQTINQKNLPPYLIVLEKIK